MSDNIIDLSERRNAAERPDAEFVKFDDFGREMYLFLLEYQMDGSTWGSEVWAYSMEDAERRVTAMRETLAVSGQAFAAIPG